MRALCQGGAQLSSRGAEVPIDVEHRPEKAETGGTAGTLLKCASKVHVAQVGEHNRVEMNKIEWNGITRPDTIRIYSVRM